MHSLGKTLLAFALLNSREGNGTPLQYSCLENPMDGVHGVAKSRTQLSDFTFTFHFHALEKKMATHSSVLAWRIPGMGEPGGLPSMGLESQTQLKQLSSSSSCFILYFKAKFACYSRCFLTSYFCILVPYNEKDTFWGVLVLEGLVGLHRTVQLQLLQHYWLGHRLGLL